MIQTAEEFILLVEKNDPRAKNDNISNLVCDLIIQKYPEYKICILQNKNVPIQVIRTLSQDKDPKVRFWVAQKRKCPEDILKKLSTDPDISVKERIAWNPKTKNDILEILEKDACLKISKLASQRLKNLT